MSRNIEIPFNFCILEDDLLVLMGLYEDVTIKCFLVVHFSLFCYKTVFNIKSQIIESKGPFNTVIHLVHAYVHVL